jgi:hypothetical protein
MLIDISQTFKSLYFYFPSIKQIVKPLVVYLNVDDTEVVLTIDMFFIGKDISTNKLVSMQIKHDNIPEILNGKQIKKILSEIKNTEKGGDKT